jgi:hypothetical protein
MGSLVDQLMGAGATSNIAGGSAAPTGGLGAAVEGATPFEYPFSNAQIMGALGRGVSPAAMLSSSAPGLASDTPLGPSTELFAGGPMGALGLAGAMSGVGVLPPAQAQAQQQWDALTDQQKAEAAYRAMQGDPKFAWVLPVITRAT